MTDAPTDAQFEMARLAANAVGELQLALAARFGTGVAMSHLALLAGRDLVAAGYAILDWHRKPDNSWRRTAHGALRVRNSPVWTVDAYDPDGWRIVHLSVPGAFDLAAPERLPTREAPQ